MSLHHHHYYDKDDKPAVLEHDHEYAILRHLEPSLLEVPIYWDHEGTDCEGTGETPE